MKKTAKASGKITLRVLLEHMQGIKQDTDEKMQKMERGFHEKFDRLETKVDRGFAQIGAQLDTIDTRLDDIEMIPSVTKHLSRRT